ncbi:MAG TPA: hypothetical protein DCP53_03065 [Elusimicrobia bacterium]|nr:hypothetical protein [Elusimicrobiota bacterium]
MKYVDGYVLAVPKKKVEVYRSMVQRGEKYEKYD